MKKIKIFILCLFFVALGTVGSVAGFYINENSTAVVNWLNNSITVSKDNYKELLEESKLTVLQLSLEIASLEEENAQLQIEKEDLTNMLAELEQTEEGNQALIQDYTLQISSLDAQIIEKDSIIADLQALISSIYEDMITELFVLPDDLKNLTFTIYGYGEDFVVLFSDKSLYEFDCSEGTLNLICKDIVTSLNVFEGGYVYNKTVSSKTHVVFHSKSTGEDTIVIEGSTIKGCLGYENGCFIAFADSTYYLNFETVTAVKSFDAEFKVSSYFKPEFREYKDKLLLFSVTTTSSSNTSVYGLDNETKVGGVVCSGLSTSHTFRVFEFKEELYLLSGYSGTLLKGLYKLNLEDYTTSLVYEFVSQTNSNIGEFFVNEDFVVWGHQKTIYLFDGETTVVSVDSSVNTVTTVTGDFTKFCETESFVYLALGVRWIKVDKVNKTISILSQSNTYMRHFNLSDGRLVVVHKASSSGYISMSLFNTETDGFDYFLIKVTDFVFEHEGKVYYIDSSSTYPTLYYKDLATSKSTNICSNSGVTVNVNSVKVYGDVLLFYSNSQYILHCPTRTIAMVKVLNTYDSTMSNIEERTFYKKLSTLDNGIVYEKVVYNEDFTDYTKSVVIVK